MRDYLLEEDIEEICKIPIISDPDEDRLRWHYCDSGRYTVKSGYELAMAKQREKENRGMSSQREDKAFTKLWKTKLDRKIIHLIWRVVKRALPTAENMRRRNMRISDLCCFCRSHPEMERHIFLECEWVQIIWNKVDIAPLLSNKQSDLGETLLGLIRSKKVVDLEMIFITIWGIWYARNCWIFKNKQIDQEAVSNIIHTKSAEQKWRRDRSHDLTSVFKPPVFRSDSQEAIIVTFDAGWMPESQQTTAGVVICSGTRELLVAAALSLPPAESARHAEVLACVKALPLEVSLHAPAVFLAGDAKLLLEEISAARERIGKREFGPVREVMKEIIELSSHFETLSVEFCGRDRVSMAHHLATHVARSGVLERWMCLFPKWLVRRFEKAVFG